MAKAKKKTKYVLVQNFDPTTHVKQINMLIEAGYILQGGVSVTVSPKNHSDLVYTQAFTYETTETDENDKTN